MDKETIDNDPLFAGSCIRTVSGMYIDPRYIEAKQINIYDIAHALSNTCRWAGHCSRFFSVAQHCVMAWRLAPPELKKDALLHDASEAYLLDMPRPFKKILPDYRKLEAVVTKAVVKRFGLKDPLPREIKEIDMYLLRTEFDALLTNDDPTFATWGPKEAYENFLTSFHYKSKV